MEDFRQEAAVFRALCDEKRLTILARLRSGEKCACVLQSQDLGLTQSGLSYHIKILCESGLSYHMKILCESGLVESRQEGKWTHYRLSESGRQRALALLEQLTAPNGEAGECGCKK